MVPPSYDEVVNGSSGNGEENEVIVVDQHIMQIRREEEEEEAEAEVEAPLTQQNHHQLFHFKSEVDGQSISSATSANVNMNRDSCSLRSTSSDAMVSTSSNRVSLGEGDDLSLDATVNVTSSDGGGLGDEVGYYYKADTLRHFPLMENFRCSQTLIKENL